MHPKAQIKNNNKFRLSSTPLIANPSLSKIGRCCSLLALGFEILTYSWIIAREGPFLGIDKTPNQFATTLQQAIVQFAPNFSVSHARYVSYSIKAVQQRSAVYASEIRLFTKSVQIFVASKSIGVTECKIISIEPNNTHENESKNFTKFQNKCNTTYGTFN